MILLYYLYYYLYYYSYYYLLYYLLLLFIIGTMLVSKKKIKFIDLLLLMVACYLGIKSIRFWPYTYIIMSYVIFNYVEKRKVEKGTIKGIILFSILLILLFGMSFDTVSIATKMGVDSGIPAFVIFSRTVLQNRSM